MRKGEQGIYAEDRDHISDDLPDMSFEEARGLGRRDHDLQTDVGIFRNDSE